MTPNTSATNTTSFAMSLFLVTVCALSDCFECHLEVAPFVLLLCELGCVHGTAGGAAEVDATPLYGVVVAGTSTVGAYVNTDVGHHFFFFPAMLRRRTVITARGSRLSWSL